MDETNDLDGMIQAADLMLTVMMAEGMTPAEICLEFFAMGHESGHICAQAHEEPLEDDPKVSAGYL
ncbi:MAG: hypothetical protein QG675_566 [Patescibacteria group bacterium]|jgi:hypothetical protein|nr:hypothetical protein [Patescibacteria group bacterium]